MAEAGHYYDYTLHVVKVPIYVSQAAPPVGGEAIFQVTPGDPELTIYHLNSEVGEAAIKQFHESRKTRTGEDS